MQSNPISSRFLISDLVIVNNTHWVIIYMISNKSGHNIQYP